MQDLVQRKSHYLGDIQLSYLEAGKPEKGTVLLLHGIPASAELWRDIGRRLAESGYRVLMPDLPGYGKTHLPKGGDYSLAGAATLLADWLAEDIQAPVHLVAHDIGGGVAQRMMTRHSELFLSATFSNAIIGDSWPVRPIVLMRLIAQLGLLIPLAALRLMPNPYVTRKLRHSLVQQTHLNPAVQRRIFWDSKFRDADGRRQFARHLLALNPDQTVQVESKLAKFDKPVQLIWGMRDMYQTWSEVGKRYHKIWPQARVDKLEDAGHFVQLDCPVEYSQYLMDFWGS